LLLHDEARGMVDVTLQARVTIRSWRRERARWSGRRRCGRSLRNREGL
jgi:hypothetical protein